MVDQLFRQATHIPIQVPEGQTNQNSSLYVGNLDPKVEEAHLYDFFKQVANVVSLKICRDEYNRSLRYGYVNFSNPNDAIRAKEVLNYTPLFGRPIRIMTSDRNSSRRLSGNGNIFIKNLDPSIDTKALYETFSTFGNVLSCKVATQMNGHSKGYGFVHFEKEEYAKTAIDSLNGTLLKDREVYVTHFIRHQDRVWNENITRAFFTNVYVKHFPKEICEEDLYNAFSKFGEITSIVVMKDQNGNSRCFGFINFKSAKSAACAVEKMNNISIWGNMLLYVARAQKKFERKRELSKRFEKTNLYIKNIDDSIDDEKLQEMFTEFGTITSSKVMVNPMGTSRGFGFVAYSNHEEASRAMNEMKRKMVGTKPLYIAFAQRKEERQANLQKKFSQITAMGSMPHPIRGFHHQNGRSMVHSYPYGYGFQPHMTGGQMSGPTQYMYVDHNGQSMVPSYPYGYSFQPQFIPWMFPCYYGQGNFMPH